MDTHHEARHGATRNRIFVLAIVIMGAISMVARPAEASRPSEHQLATPGSGADPAAAWTLTKLTEWPRPSGRQYADLHLALDHDGHLHAISMHDEDDPSIWYATNKSGKWTIRDDVVPHNIFLRAGGFWGATKQLSVAPDGALHVMVAASGMRSDGTFGLGATEWRLDYGAGGPTFSTETMADVASRYGDLYAAFSAWPRRQGLFAADSACSYLSFADDRWTAKPLIRHTVWTTWAFAVAPDGQPHALCDAKHFTIENGAWHDESVKGLMRGDSVTIKIGADGEPVVLAGLDLFFPPNWPHKVVHVIRRGPDGQWASAVVPPPGLPSDERFSVLAFDALPSGDFALWLRHTSETFGDDEGSLKIVRFAHGAWQQFQVAVPWNAKRDASVDGFTEPDASGVRHALLQVSCERGVGDACMNGVYLARIEPDGEYGDVPATPTTAPIDTPTPTATVALDTPVPPTATQVATLVPTSAPTDRPTVPPTTVPTVAPRPSETAEPRVERPAKVFLPWTGRQVLMMTAR